MNKVSNNLTIYFENPFWVGVFERTEANKLWVCKATFGAEPKDYEVYEYILKHFFELRFSDCVAVEARKAADNPKRRLRNARRQTETRGVGTKSQQALQLQREAAKVERRQLSREQREAEEMRRYEMKRQKKKDKHRGR